MTQMSRGLVAGTFLTGLVAGSVMGFVTTGRRLITVVVATTQCSPVPGMHTGTPHHLHDLDSNEEVFTCTYSHSP